MISLKFYLLERLLAVVTESMELMDDRLIALEMPSAITSKRPLATDDVLLSELTPDAVAMLLLLFVVDLKLLVFIALTEA